jgi:hypothetical protein
VTLVQITPDTMYFDVGLNSNYFFNGLNFGNSAWKGQNSFQLMLICRRQKQKYFISVPKKIYSVSCSFLHPFLMKISPLT